MNALATAADVNRSSVAAPGGSLFSAAEKLGEFAHSAAVRRGGPALPPRDGAPVKQELPAAVTGGRAPPTPPTAKAVHLNDEEPPAAPAQTGDASVACGSGAHRGQTAASRSAAPQAPFSLEAALVHLGTLGPAAVVARVGNMDIPALQALYRAVHAGQAARWPAPKDTDRLRAKLHSLLRV